MKIFKIDRCCDVWPEEARLAVESAEAAPVGVLPVRLIADSAVVRNNRPVFVPDFAREGWVVEVLPAIHIGRLGKFISPRFAHRHISGFSLVASLHSSRESSVNALTDSFDGAIVTGELTALPDVDVLVVSAQYKPLPKRGMTEEPEAQTLNIEMAISSLHIAETVALLSRYATLKSGDIIIPVSSGISFPVRLDYTLTASNNKGASLTMRLK